MDKKLSIRGGVAQLGEHLPCKQGVKSSNLSVSIGSFKTGGTVSLYLENRILKNLKYQRLIFAKNKDCQDDKTSEAVCETNSKQKHVIEKITNQPYMQRYAWNTVRGVSGYS